MLREAALLGYRVSIAVHSAPERSLQSNRAKYLLPKIVLLLVLRQPHCSVPRTLL